MGGSCAEDEECTAGRLLTPTTAVFAVVGTAGVVALAARARGTLRLLRWFGRLVVLVSALPKLASPWGLGGNRSTKGLLLWSGWLTLANGG